MTPEPPRRTDDGFTLIEVMVSVGIFVVVMVAVLSQVLIGIRGSARANEVTELKGVVEAQMELMRNLPWHVAPSAEQRIDILDRYFPDVEPPAGPVECGTAAAPQLPDSDSWTGYVDPPGAASSRPRCSYEPQKGAFYRSVETVNPSEPASYVLVIDVQFLRSTLPVSPAAYGPVPAEEPPTDYDSDVVNKDAPVSTQVGVTVTAFDRRTSPLKAVSDYTQIAEAVRAPQRVQAVANATAVELSGVTTDARSVSVRAGVLELGGFLSRVSTGTARLDAVDARIAGEPPAGLVAGPLAAPPSSSLAARLAGPGAVPTGNACAAAYICWGSSSTSALNVVASNGLPAVGSSALSAAGYPLTSDPPAPVGASLTPTSAAALQFDTTLTAERGRYAAGLALSATDPLVRVSGTAATLSGCGTSSAGSLLAQGYLGSTTTAVKACAEAGSATISLFPTKSRAAGILDVSLTYSRAMCSAAHGGAFAPAADYSVKVQVWRWSQTGYSAVPETFTMAATKRPTDADRARLQALLAIPVDEAGQTLASYVDSWSLGDPQATTAAATAGSTMLTASATVPGALALMSTTLRTGVAAGTADPDSAIALTVGAVSCTAGDGR